MRTAGFEPATTFLAKEALYPLSYVVDSQIVSLVAAFLACPRRTIVTRIPTISVNFQVGSHWQPPCCQELKEIRFTKAYV